MLTDDEQLRSGSDDDEESEDLDDEFVDMHILIFNTLMHTILIEFFDWLSWNPDPVEEKKFFDELAKHHQKAGLSSLFDFIDIWTNIYLMWL